MNNQNKATKARNMRRLRFGTASTVLTIVVIVGVILLNVLVDVVADRYPITWDLSADKTFTLSEQSIEIAESLEKELEIVVFVDEASFTNPTTGANAGIPEYDTAMREFYNACDSTEPGLRKNSPISSSTLTRIPPSLLPIRTMM